MSYLFVQMDQFTHYVILHKRLVSLTDWTTVQLLKQQADDLLHIEEQTADLLVICFQEECVCNMIFMKDTQLLKESNLPLNWF
jgi:hypothetical protein